MRLINVDTLQLEEFFDGNIKPYAILSHRWEEEEVTFRDIQDIETASCLKGFEKIQNTCQQASKDGYHYAWIDTCCINKESSAELSEAINSMFRWYQNSEVCYAYLSDVDSSVNFTLSAWFTRGWTLQELLAPTDVRFYDRFWRSLGNRLDRKNELIARCGVASLWNVPLTDYSVAKRMSWASNRITTRPEDMAYCLLGIFGVNMPLLYGEGSRAFIRLQEEIIKQIDDQTIFAWPMPRPEPCGLLAPSPKVFENVAELWPVPSRKGRSAYSMTNRGLNIKLLAKPFLRNVYIARLVCSEDMMEGPENEPEEHSYTIIFLRRRFEDDQYVRVSQGGISLFYEKGYSWRLDHVAIFEIDVNVRQVEAYQSVFDRDSAVPVFPGFLMSKTAEITFTARESRIHSQGDNYQFIEMTQRSPSGVAGELRIHRDDGLSDIRLYFGHDLGFNPVCYVSVPREGIPDRSDDLMPYGMYQWESWSPRLLHGMAKREVKEWHEVGSDIWLLKGDRIDGLDFRLFRGKEYSMVGRVIIEDKKNKEISYWKLAYEFPSSTITCESEQSILNKALTTESREHTSLGRRTVNNHEWLSLC